jgi:2,5-diamino-6-(ribosylamino)-4(3H)-pyrimidinone 5'-phosphate reductase
MSADGKISTGFGDKTDFDKDIPLIAGAREGLKQYYDYEQTTDSHSMISGKILAKLGFNKKQNINKTQISFIVVDNKNLTRTGVENIARKSKHLYILTTNKTHPAVSYKADNITVCLYDKKVDFLDVFRQFYEIFGIKRITIQTGGTLNTQFVREGYIDELSIFIAPVLVGGKDTPTLLDGVSIKSAKELKQVKAMKLISANKLKNSYLHLRYKIL